MSNFDVRVGESTITELTFANKSTESYYPDVMVKAAFGGVKIIDTDSDRWMSFKDREHVDNFIKAYEKAKQLGWI